ncbi:hypothetical protein LZ30DRAFT_703530 [Colletotrichum cereale]|nr:hypothetical protein LZ30DRAFT_703530 [Colletotrichum cereale]
MGSTFKFQRGERPAVLAIVSILWLFRMSLINETTTEALVTKLITLLNSVTWIAARQKACLRRQLIWKQGPADMIIPLFNRLQELY